ncbi:transposase [Nocardia sienata]|uniref:transposase n=1 Tax=Nocardia sienata TaxID=248552 RepID=UPI0007A3D2D2|nr:transposase [Nocardia sienata]
MSRHTAFRYCLDPTVEQCARLARHAGAARFAFNQCLHMVKTALGGGWVGIDRGLSAFLVAATADGAETVRINRAPKPLAAGQARQRRLAKALSRKQKGSRNRTEAAARLARHHHRIADVRRHFLHQVTNRLVKTHDRLVIEDLHVAGMLRNRRLSRRSVMPDGRISRGCCTTNSSGAVAQWCRGHGGSLVPVE